MNDRHTTWDPQADDRSGRRVRQEFDDILRRFDELARRTDRKFAELTVRIADVTAHVDSQAAEVIDAARGRPPRPTEPPPSAVPPGDAHPPREDASLADVAPGSSPMDPRMGHDHALGDFSRTGHRTRAVHLAT